MKTRILIGDCRESLRRLPSGSVQCVVTSPPYFGLRDYGHAGQIGLEPTPDEFIAAMVEVFGEVHRVLRDDGTLWLNLGDSYSSGGRTTQTVDTARGPSKRDVGGDAASGKQEYLNGTAMRPPVVEGLAGKNLLGIPWRVALALQADGWYLRSEIIWAKPNPMPESVTDRPTKSHEKIFLMSKSERYFYDAEAVKETAIHAGRIVAATGADSKNGSAGYGSDTKKGFTKNDTAVNDRRNLRDVWTITTKPFSGAHFATFPPDIPERCIKAGTSERGACPTCGAPWVRETETETEFAGGSGRAGRTAEEMNGSGKWRNGGEAGNANLKLGPVTRSKTTGWVQGCDCPDNSPVPCVVLDPFGGAGTTGLVAGKLGRDAILCELNPDYADMARERIAGELGGMFTTVVTEASCPQK